MSEQTPHKQPLLTNPQVLVAMLGTVTTIVVAIIGIVPSIITASLAPTPTATPIVITATPLVASATFTPFTLDATATTVTLMVTDSVLPTDTPVVIPTATATNTETAIPSATVVTQSANITLIWDTDSFTLLNASGQNISLEGITFQSTNGSWQASQWGNTIYNALPVAKCLRLRDAAVGNRQPPAPCNNNIWGLMQVGTSAFFWKNVSAFDVILNGTIINTCDVSTGTCGIYVEP